MNQCFKPALSDFQPGWVHLSWFFCNQGQQLALTCDMPCNISFRGTVHEISQKQAKTYPLYIAIIYC